MILIFLIDVRLHKYPCALYYLLCVFSILHWMRHSAVKAIILQNKVTVDSYVSIDYRRTDISAYRRELYSGSLFLYNNSSSTIVGL